MAEVLPLSDGELRLLESLLRHHVRFMVVGLSAAALQGAPVVTEDIDLWFESLGGPELTRAMREVGGAYVPPFELNPPMLAGPHCEPFDVVISMSGLGTFAQEMNHTIEMDVGPVRLRVLALERILLSKIAANRPKDRLVIPALQDAIRVIRSRESKE